MPELARNMHDELVSGPISASLMKWRKHMRALMNLAIEPALRLFEVSTLVVITPSQQAVQRVLKVLADTPVGAIQIVRDRYPRSRSHQVLACHVLNPQMAA